MSAGAGRGGQISDPDGVMLEINDAKTVGDTATAVNRAEANWHVDARQQSVYFAAGLDIDLNASGGDSQWWEIQNRGVPLEVVGAGIFVSQTNQMRSTFAVVPASTNNVEDFLVKLGADTPTEGGREFVQADAFEPWYFPTNDDIQVRHNHYNLSAGADSHKGEAYLYMRPADRSTLDL